VRPEIIRYSAYKSARTYTLQSGVVCASGTTPAQDAASNFSEGHSLAVPVEAPGIEAHQEAAATGPVEGIGSVPCEEDPQESNSDVPLHEKRKAECETYKEAPEKRARPAEERNG
jgi:hypothetical protein